MSRILIVEDDPAVGEVVEYALSREGMGTLTVGEGRKRWSASGARIPSTS